MLLLSKRGVCHKNLIRFQRAVQQIRVATVTIEATMSQLQPHLAPKYAQIQTPFTMSRAFLGLSKCHYNHECHFRQVTMNST